MCRLINFCGVFNRLHSLFCGALWALIFSSLSGLALARPLSIVLAPGDPATPTAVVAVKQLRQDPALKEVDIHLLSRSRMGEKQLTLLAASDAALVHNMGREFSDEIAPAVARMAQRGAKAFAIGSPFEEGKGKLV